MSFSFNLASPSIKFKKLTVGVMYSAGLLLVSVKSIFPDIFYCLLNISNFFSCTGFQTNSEAPVDLSDLTSTTV